MQVSVSEFANETEDTLSRSPSYVFSLSLFFCCCCDPDLMGYIAGTIEIPSIYIPVS